MSVRIRQMEPADHGPVNHFFNRIYGASRTLDQFQWEVEGPPIQPTVFFLAEDPTLPPDERVVGTQSVLMIPVVDAGGTEWLTGKSEHTLVDPRYRGQQILERMYEGCFASCRERGVAFIWGFTYARKPFARLGFSLPFQVSQGAFVLRSGPAAAYLKSLSKPETLPARAKLLAFCAGSRVMAVVRPRLTGADASVTIDTPALGDQSEIIAASYPPGSGLFGIKQDAGFVNWRLTTNPYENTYTMTRATKDGAHQGTVIANVRPEGLAYITQLAFRDDADPAIAARAVLHVCRELGNSGAALIRFNGFDTNAVNRRELSVLTRCGFLFAKKGIDFVWLELDGAGRDPNHFVLSRMAYLGTV